MAFALYPCWCLRRDPYSAPVYHHGYRGVLRFIPCFQTCGRPAYPESMGLDAPHLGSDRLHLSCQLYICPFSGDGYKRPAYLYHRAAFGQPAGLGAAAVSYGSRSARMAVGQDRAMAGSSHVCADRPGLPDSLKPEAAYRVISLCAHSAASYHWWASIIFSSASPRPRHAALPSCGSRLPCSPTVRNKSFTARTRGRWCVGGKRQRNRRRRP